MIPNENSPARSPRESERLLPALVFVCALSVRLAAIALVGVRSSPDAEEYLEIARNLAWDGAFGVSHDGLIQPTTRRAPGFPLFLAALMRLGLDSRGGFLVTQVVLSSIGASLLCLTVGIFASRRAATAAGLFYAVHPGAILCSISLLSEAIASFLVILSIWVGAKAMERPQAPSLAALTGAILGGAVLCRPALLPWAAAAGVVLFGAWRPTRVKQAAMALAAVGVVVLPWVVRTSRVAEGLVFLQGGSVAPLLYVASRSDWDQKNETVLWNLLANDPECGRPLNFPLSVRVPPPALRAADQACLEAARQRIRADPGSFLLSRLRSLPFLVFTSYDSLTLINTTFGQAWRGRQWLVLATKTFLLAAFSVLPFILGCLALVLGRGRLLLVCNLAWVIAIVAHAPGWVEPRYFWPAIGPQAAAAVAFLFDAGARFRPR